MLAIPQIVDIKGYADRYCIDIHGNVYRKRKKGLVKLTPYLKNGVYCVGLVDGGGRKKLHTLNTLMKTNYFHCDSPDFGMYHKNGLEADCSYWNLRLVHKKELGKLTGGQSRSQSVLMLDESTGEIISIYPSARKAASHNYCSYQTIIDRCNGKVRKSLISGVKFLWEKDYEETLYR